MEIEDWLAHVQSTAPPRPSPWQNKWRRVVLRAIAWIVAAAVGAVAVFVVAHARPEYREAVQGVGALALLAATAIYVNQTRRLADIQAAELSHSRNARRVKATERFFWLFVQSARVRGRITGQVAATATRFETAGTLPIQMPDLRALRDLEDRLLPILPKVLLPQAFPAATLYAAIHDWRTVLEDAIAFMLAAHEHHADDGATQPQAKVAADWIDYRKSKDRKGDVAWSDITSGNAGEMVDFVWEKVARDMLASVIAGS